MGVLTYGKLHPLVALCCSILWLFSGLLMVGTPQFMGFLLGYVMLLAFFGYGKMFLKMQLMAIPVALVLGCMVELLYGGYKGFHHGLRMYLVMLTAILTLSIEPISFVRVLEKKKIPSAWTLGILIALRFIHVLREEMRRIILAMKLRGFRRIYLKPKLMYRAFLVPLLIRIFSISDTLSMSLELRGFSMVEKRSIFQVQSFCFVDGLFLFLSLGLNIGGIYLVYFIA